MEFRRLYGLMDGAATAGTIWQNLQVASSCSNSTNNATMNEEQMFDVAAEPKSEEKANKKRAAIDKPASAKKTNGPTMFEAE